MAALSASTALQLTRASSPELDQTPSVFRHNRIEVLKTVLAQTRQGPARHAPSGGVAATSAAMIAASLRCSRANGFWIATESVGALCEPGNTPILVSGSLGLVGSVQLVTGNRRLLTASTSGGSAAYRTIPPVRDDDALLPDVDAHREFLDLDVAATAPLGGDPEAGLRAPPMRRGNTGGDFECG